ncbi:MAG TPA: hypothetical protein VNW73_14735 [Ktedonobacteraceae bacterium]|nr:hypothetical protein [Ktedonobacteraceae bacterium]
MGNNGATASAAVTLRQGTPPHGFFCLSSVGDGLSSGAWLRLGAYRSGGGKAERAHPSLRVLSWAVPCPLVLSCLSERDRWPTTPVSGVLERINTRIFRCCSPGNVPQRWRLFLGAIFGAAARTLCRGVATRAFAAANSSYSGEHGRVFTHRPSRWNPYTIQLFKVLPISSFCASEKR